MHAWSNPERCSDHSVSFGHGVSQLSGHAEVGQLGVTLGVQEDVASLDVSVDPQLTVEVVKAVEAARADGGYLVLS